MTSAILAEPLYRFFTVAGFVAHSPTVLLLQDAAKIAPYRWVVVYYQNTNHSIFFQRPKRTLHEKKVCAAQRPGNTWNA